MSVSAPHQSSLSSASSSSSSSSYLPPSSLSSILLSSNVSRARSLLATLTSPYRLLLHGCDAPSCIALAHLLFPELHHHTCVSLPSSSSLSPTAPLLLDHADIPSSTAPLSRLLTRHKGPIICLSPSITPRLRSLFSATYRVTAPTAADREVAWRFLKPHIATFCPAFQCPSNAEAVLTSHTPAYTLSLFQALLQRFVALPPSEQNYSALLSLLQTTTRSSNLHFLQPLPPASRLFHAGYPVLKQKIERLLTWPFTFASTYTRLAVSPPRGVLLHGVAGVGKTLLVNSVLAKLTSVNVITVHAPALFSKFLGETERNIRLLFAHAASMKPCILFIDDIDAIATARSENGDEQTMSSVLHRTVATLLAEIDGVHREDIFLVATVGEVHVLDHALVRPGRFDHVLHVPLPELHDRVCIVEGAIRKMCVSEKESVVRSVAESMEGCSGATIMAVCREAAMLALENVEADEGQGEIVDLQVAKVHFERAIETFVKRK